ncbi:MAG: aminoacyl-histidine dipeptidase [Fusobacteriaceae bacterium]
MNILKNLEPAGVMKYFEELSSIPRASKKEQKVSDWLVKFAKDKNLEVIQDQFLNVIIKKPATTGYEHVPTLILQGHMDMVCEKNQDTIHDFDKEGIKLRIDGDLIKGTGTTLGADNGIAVAFALALLDSDFPHPALEVLITADEEMGMTGAINLNGSILSGKLMLNLDTEEEGEIYVSCAGGASGNLEIPVRWEEIQNKEEGFSIQIKGLQGGHSGADIHLQKGNSNKLLGRVLNEIRKDIKFNIAEITGGAKANAIPREANAVIVTNPANLEKLTSIVKKMENIFKEEYRVAEPTVHINIISKKVTKAMNKLTSNTIIDAITLHASGINSWSLDIEGLVESSLNLGVIEQYEDKIIFRSAIRGSVASKKIEMIETLKVLAKTLNISFRDTDHYPAWEYNPDSKLRDIFVEVYEKTTGKKVGLKAIHAGLECGVLSEKIPGVDIISFGPNIRGAHTPEESVSISSIANTWSYFLEGIKALKSFK